MHSRPSELRTRHVRRNNHLSFRQQLFAPYRTHRIHLRRQVGSRGTKNLFSCGSADLRIFIDSSRLIVEWLKIAGPLASAYRHSLFTVILSFQASFVSHCRLTHWNLNTLLRQHLSSLGRVRDSSQWMANDMICCECTTSIYARLASLSRNRFSRSIIFHLQYAHSLCMLNCSLSAACPFAVVTPS